MKTLLLLRHARAHRGGGDDHERPLEPGGERAAARMGRHLAERGHRPDLALCSSARRSVETLEQLLPHLPQPPRVCIERGLYLAARGELLARLGRVDDGEQAVLLVGHNPELGGLAVSLAGRGDPRERGRLARGLPPAGLAALAFAVGSWGELAPGGGLLVEFTIPGELA